MSMHAGGDCPAQSAPGGGMVTGGWRMREGGNVAKNRLAGARPYRYIAP